MRKGLLLLVLTLLTCFPAWSQSQDDDEEVAINEESGDVNYEPQGIVIDGLTYLLGTGGQGKARIRRENCWEGELVIPIKVEHNGVTYMVTGLSWKAFVNCRMLTKVTIPKTIDGIYTATAWPSWYMNPFIGCTALESIEVDEDNPSYCSIDGVMFTKDKKSLICYPAGSKQRHYTVPDDVRTIRYEAFAHSPYLVSVTFPSHDITMLSAFTGCSALESVTLPEEMKFIPSGTFMGCTSLKSIDIPANVIEIESSAFEGCSSLTTVELPLRLTKIGAAAFKDCSSLHTLVINGHLRRDNITNGLWLEYLDPEQVTIYAQPTQVELIKEHYSGTVLPLDQYHPEGDPNAIQAVKAESSSAESVFDLQGRRVSRDAHGRGVYVKNGKKTVVN